MANKWGGKMIISKKIASLLGEAEDLFPPASELPWWIPEVRIPEMFDAKNPPPKDLYFNLTENVCGLTITYGLIKRGFASNFVVYNDRKEQIPFNNKNIAWQFPEVYKTLVDIRRHYNANEVVLQAKILEKDNYYNLTPKVLAFCLYIDGIEQELDDMAYWLRRHNIGLVPVLDIKKTINKKTKENYSVQSKLANVPSKGIICTNRQKSLSFLL